MFFNTGKFPSLSFIFVIIRRMMCSNFYGGGGDLVAPSCPTLCDPMD